jgi:outer membrane protein
LQVDGAYLDVLKSNAVRGVAEKTLALRQAVFARTRALTQNQLRSELDQRLAQVSVDEARLLIDAAEKDMQAAITTLSNLIGDNAILNTRPLELPPVPAALPTDFSPLTSLALAQRPELARYRAEADAARATARAARDARLPTVSVMASAGYIPIEHPQFDTKYAAGGVNLNIPLFAGGLYRARQREAELQASVADAATQETINTITRDVRLAWLEAVHARERIGLTASLLENANAALTLARARFDQGLTSTVELTQAELAQTSAEIAQSTADYAYRVRRDILDFQTGTLR